MHHIFKTLFAIIFCLFANQIYSNEESIEESLMRSQKIRGYYNITASDTHKFVWFRVAKIGTRSIFQVLTNNNVPLAIDRGSNIPFKPENYKDYFKFAFVRNPWARVVSCYFDKVKKKHRAFKECYDKDFDFFVDFINRQDLANADRHIRLQSKLIPLDEVDFIGRTENFSEDLSYVMNLLGFINLDIPHKHASQHEHYSRYYTPRTKEIIGRKYRKDIETFGYEFEYK